MRQAPPVYHKSDAKKEVELENVLLFGLRFSSYKLSSCHDRKRKNGAVGVEKGTKSTLDDRRVIFLREIKLLKKRNIYIKKSIH